MKKKENPPNQKEEISLISLRVPLSILKEFKELAEKETRSLSNMIIIALKEFLNNRKSKK